MEWVVGAEVVFFLERNRFRRATVEKVYKNGNVVIEGRQYRPDGACAFRCGMPGRFRVDPTAYLRTPKVEESVKRILRRRRLHKVADWLSKQDADLIPEEALAPIIDLMKKELNAPNP